MTGQQLPLALRFPADQRLDGYLGNAAAVALARACARDESRDWLMFSGPPGCGKSHLLMAICAEAGASGRRPVYLGLTARLDRSLNEALVGLERGDPVCLDGLDGIAGDRDSELAVFDLHNRARAAGTVVVYAARATPARLPLSLPDLRSRLAQCVQVPLITLDDGGRRELLRQRAARRGMSLDEAVLDYLFARVGRDPNTLTALLDRLDRASLAAQRRITVPFLRQVLEL